MRLFRRAAALAAVSAAALAAACGEDAPTDPTTPVPPLSADVSLSLVPLDAYGLGAAAHGCTGAPYRQFDFWLGRWDVFSGTTLAGTNVVKSRVDGCVVEENWTSASLGRGRSLNAYDAVTKRWQQVWMDNQGGVNNYFGQARDGNLYYEADGVYVPNQPKLVKMKMTFFNQGKDQVRQLIEQSTDEGKTYTVAYDLIYTRRTP